MNLDSYFGGFLGLGLYIMGLLWIGFLIVYAAIFYNITSQYLPSPFLPFVSKDKIDKQLK